MHPLALGLLTSRHVLSGVDRQPRERAVHHRDVAEIADPGSRPPHQCRKDRDRGRHPTAGEVSYLHSGDGRPPVLLADDPQHARVADVVGVVAGDL
jgi:hypothetical protein